MWAFVLKKIIIKRILKIPVKKKRHKSNMANFFKLNESKNEFIECPLYIVFPNIWSIL